MKVFISSVIAGLEESRTVTSEGIRALGHEVLQAEAFSARPDSPQVSCLRAVRESDVVVLIVGSRYGAPQQSGLSATHEEYQEGIRESKPVLVFVQEGVDRESDEQQFLAEVQGWERGHFTTNFQSPPQLRDNVTRALH